MVAEEAHEAHVTGMKWQMRRSFVISMSVGAAANRGL